MTGVQRALAGAVLAVAFDLLAAWALGRTPPVALALACGLLGGLLVSADIVVRLVRLAGGRR